jgi:hypothetical protein
MQPVAPASRSPSLEVVDARADPRFATHLRPIFTEVIAEQQEKLRQQNILDMERKEMAQKAKQRIAVYPWTSENTPPTVNFFQDFPWPYLTITSDLLATIGLLEASDQGNLRMYDEKEILDWVAIHAGYVMEVHEGQHLFLKDASVRKCIDFQKSLDTRSQASTPHLHNHLAHERAYVREMHKSMSNPSSPQEPLSPLPSTTSTISFQQPPSLAVTQLTPVIDPILSPLPPSLPLPSPDQTSFASGSGGHDDPIDIDDDEKHWPTDYYTFDIGKCMRECNSRTHRLHQRSNTQRTIFLKWFPNVRFIPSTFSNQRELWIKASVSLREEFMELGRCKEGLWSAFAKRARQEQKSKSKPAVIEID